MTFAILGLLDIEPMSGYDMKALADRTLAHFWKMSFGTLYPRLRTMEADGLIRGTVAPRADAPDARVYVLTEAGRAALTAWLAEDPAPDEVRSELLLKIFFGSEGSTHLVEAHLRAERDRLGGLLESFRAMEATLRAEGAGNPRLPFWLLTLRRGRHTTAARLRWCEESIRALRPA